MKSQTTSPLLPVIPNPSTDRLFVLDVLKAISIVAVVSYHAVFVPISTYQSSQFWVDIVFSPLRFCVPVLLAISFLLSDYGLSKRGTEASLPWLNKRLNRLAIPTLIWFGIAGSLKLLTGNSLAEISKDLLTGEIFTGAYYLLIMFQLTVIFFWCRQWLKHPKNLLITILAQGFIFLIIYAALSGRFGEETTVFLNTLNRPPFFYWFAYVAVGIGIGKLLPTLTRQSQQISAVVKILLLVGLSAGLILEQRQLWILTDGSIPPFEYAMVSCLLSVPVMFWVFGSIQESSLHPRIHKAILLLSNYSLGIFCINGILSQILLSIGSKLFESAVFNLPEILMIKMIGWCVLLSVSLGLSMLIARFGMKTIVC